MIQQGTPEWFELRKGYPTASHFSDVMAEGKGKEEAVTRRNYRMKLALERFTGRVVEESFSGNKHTERGNEFEPFARMMYESQTGYFVNETAFIFNDKISAGCSPDGLVSTVGLAEFKCPLPAIHWDYLTAKDKTQPPAVYKWQVYGQILVTGRDWCDFISYCDAMSDRLKLQVRRIYANEEMLKQLEAGIKKFNDDVEATISEMKQLEAAA